VLPIISLLIIANTINIGADIGAMAASASLIIPQIPLIIFNIFFTIIIIIAIIKIPYKKYVRLLKYLTLSLFTYITTAIIVGGNWYQIFYATLVPHFEFSVDFATMLVTVFGTTISSYLFFWQTYEEVEEEISKQKITEIDKESLPHVNKKEIKSMRKDTAIGIGFAHLITWSIIITTSGSLHDHGITDIQSAEQAAKYLEPLVKSFPFSEFVSKLIFVIGIIGIRPLSIPVLSGSTAYSLSDTFKWNQGLSKRFNQAKAFYLVIAISSIIGLCLNFLGINPIKTLVYASIINGVVSLPIFFLIMKIANDKVILKENTNGPLSNIIGWISFMIMTISTIIKIFTFGK
jgi:Mn2+/Fe2+ NRAMP family transporter